ncbi:TIGR03826 family flagellar region protein [Niallia nealsonii]|uniref:Flagellar operon protein TIGR03826 n=1 Tax=Niallia nealsonii TaxID=115979 RepID=A0A2N0YXV8_9BACI|nr:TIGR03826 family flagellar region protein [Niallia nealsonii]PKG22086.1 hypothetical protein CWS01_19145 [Niallia nealsonii]
MANLENCPKCGELYVVNSFRETCTKCWKEEEADFDKVYQFIRKKHNRTAKMDEVVEATGVKETLIYKFIKKGRITLAQFPNLGYPCAKCGTEIRAGKLCSKCSADMKTGLKSLEAEETRKKERTKRSSTYYSEKE